MAYSRLADLVALLHAGYVLFVVVGLLLILLGWGLRWSWVRNFWFRAVHLISIVIVGLEAAVGWDCPLTDLEKYLRSLAGEESYAGDFLGHWADRLLFHENVPQWVFTTGHIAFALLVIAVFALVPPRWPWGRGGPSPKLR